MRRQKGISLIVLVITIIVIIILASAVILSLANNNPIAQASEATFKSDIDAYNSELSMTLSKKYVDSPTLNAKQLNATTWDGIASITGTVKEYIPSMSVEDCKNYIIDEGRLAYVGSDVTEIQWLTNSNMIPAVYKFDYTGSVQTFTAPIAGTYTLEVWGASGGGDDGSGGAGGGLVGEDARWEGVYKAGTGATQTLGALGIGQSATSGHDTGGGGGGYRGGLATNYGNAGAGGGSGYIGGVANGVTQTGGNDGNGRARITLM